MDDERPTSMAFWSCSVGSQPGSGTSVLAQRSSSSLTSAALVAVVTAWRMSLSWSHRSWRARGSEMAALEEGNESDEKLDTNDRNRPSLSAHGHQGRAREESTHSGQACPP